MSETGDELQRLWPREGGLTQNPCLLGSCCRPSEGAFDSLRLWVLVVLCLLRLAVTRSHLQAYLCLAKTRVEQLRKEAGRIEAREIQQRVCTPSGTVPGLKGPGRGVPALGRSTPLQPLLPPHQVVRVYCYVTVVSLQYLTPLILTLHCTLLLKTLGAGLVGKEAGARSGKVGPSDKSW